MTQPVSRSPNNLSPLALLVPYLGQVGQGLLYKDWIDMKIYDFDDFASTSAGRRAATLLRDHKVKPEQMFAMVLAEVTQRLPYLEDGGKYTTKALCDADDWAKWFTAERRVAGMCVAYIAKKRMVELYKHRTLSGKGSAKFRTTPSPVPVGRPIKIVRLRRSRSARNKFAGSMTCL